MTKATRRATKTDRLIANARGEQQIRGLNRHRIIPRVIQPPSGGANTPPSGQGSGSTGNFLEPQGDTMIGAIAFFPKVAAIDGTNPDNPSIDIGNAGEDYSTYVLSGGTDPLDKIGSILNASFAGQLLYLQSTALPSLELINGDATNLGNILTGTGDSIFLDFGQIATLIFDVTAGTGGVGIQGAWRVIDGTGGSGSGGNAKTGFMLTSTGSTQVVASGAPVLLDVFNITVIADGVTVNTTNDTLIPLETGRYIFGLNLTLAADVNNTTADFALVVNGVPLTNVNSVFLRGFGDNSGLYPTAPFDFTANDILEVEISHDKGVPVTFTFQECGFYLIKQESGGGGGGATQLNDLTDVSLSTPADDQVLTFNGSSLLWENKAFPSGGMATDLSNMATPTVPTVDLVMNGQSVTGVLNLDFDGFGGIQGLSSLDFFQSDQNISSLSQGLIYQVQLGAEHLFLVGGANGIKIDDVGGGVIKLDLLTNDIINADTISFAGGLGVNNLVDGIGFNTDGATPFMQYNVGDTSEFHRFEIQGNPRLEVSLGGISVQGTMDSQIVQLNIGGSPSLIAGRMRSDGTDVLIFSGGEERNISATGQSNLISQGDSQVIVLDSGTGSVTTIIDGNVKSTQDTNNLAQLTSMSMNFQNITGLGDLLPAVTSNNFIGGSTLFFAGGFFDTITFENLNNRIEGNTGGLDYFANTAGEHKFLIGGFERFTVQNGQIDMFRTLLMNNNDIQQVRDLIMQSGGLIDMVNGTITSVGRINMGSSSDIVMDSGDITGLDDLTFAGSGSFLDLNFGDAINIDRCEVNGEFNHKGTTFGFFSQSPSIRRVVLNPQNTTNNELFTRLNDLINALGTINGFGLGIIDTQN